MGIATKISQSIDDAKLDLDDAIQAFKDNPCADTLDDVYRFTGMIEKACRDCLESNG